jgi:hypothetical protein
MFEIPVVYKYVVNAVVEGEWKGQEVGNDMGEGVMLMLLFNVIM